MERTSQWLATPWSALRDLVPGDLPQPPSAPAEEAVAAVPVADEGEPMVVVPGTIPSRHVYRELSLRLTPERMYLRTGVVRRLQQAQRSLPAGLELCVLDGWRSAEFQDELLAGYRHSTGLDLQGYVSDPEHARLVPPHTTGGAVDLTLAARGVPLALGTDFDTFAPAAHLLALEGEGAASTPALRLARDLRRVLARALTQAGFAPFPTEWWHWSYGDQRWAAHAGAGATHYSPTTDVPVDSGPTVPSLGSG